MTHWATRGVKVNPTKGSEAGDRNACLHDRKVALPTNPLRENEVHARIFWERGGILRGGDIQVTVVTGLAATIGTN
jgi:hypothetical protein